MAIRRAKIVCTIGPASDGEGVLEEVIRAGMDVARLNFSHGTHAEHGGRIELIRRVAQRCGKEVALLQDLCGPKIRCGRFVGGTRPLESGQAVVLLECQGSDVAAEGEVGVQYPGLAEDLEAGDELLLDDGRVSLRVTRVEGERVHTQVEQGGTLRDKVGVHIPAERVRLETLTEKDKRDLAFGLDQGVDYVALSFVRTAAEVHLVRDICDAWGRPTPIVAKIETPQAIEHLEAIILASDAVMVARGDLGVEFSPARVPVMQRSILAIARKYERPVIVATEMMQSMITATRPTRAEASDVATAVFDGTDALMLSGETATGDHPALVVRTMHRIIVEVEQSSYHDLPHGSSRDTSVAQAISRGACEIAEQVGARVIVAFTETGRSARYASQARPSVPIIGLSPNVKTLRQLSLMWGVVPLHLEPAGDSDAMIDRAHALLLVNGIVSPGDSFVTIFGAPVGVSGSTNAIQVKVVE